MQRQARTKNRFIIFLNGLLLFGIFLLIYQLAGDEARGRQELISEEFIRGDSNDDSNFDISDAVFTLGFLFLGGDYPTCLAAADLNDDARIEITDAIYALNFLFQGGPPPAEPYPDPGLDPTPDLGCRVVPEVELLPMTGSLGGPDIELTQEEGESWLRGRRLFHRMAGVQDGLGPLFNGDSCRGCHLDPIIGGAGGLDVNVVRYAYVDEKDNVSSMEGGPAVSRLSIDGFARDEFPKETNVIETRQTPTIFGLGFIDRIPDEIFIGLADPDDSDGDGISGRVRMVNGRVGRFGHKCGVPTLEDFTADALLNEMGLTVHSDHSLFAGSGMDADAIQDPELADSDFLDLVFYVQHIARPPQHEPEDSREREIIEQGAQLFVQIGCDSCHIPELPGSHGPVRVHSDFLLHDVADPGRYNVNEDDTSPREFRTSPLWGLTDTAPYLHDGSAETLDAAIRGHFGEASAAKTDFQSLGSADQLRLLSFLESL